MTVRPLHRSDIHWIRRARPLGWARFDHGYRFRNGARLSSQNSVLASYHHWRGDWRVRCSPARVGIAKPKLWPLVIILAAVVGFAFIAEFFGFVAASVWLLLVGSIADRDSRLREVILLTAGLTAFGALVFIVGLGVQMPIWPF